MSRVHVGTMGWSYRFWVGRLYPEDSKPEEYLSEYSTRFDTVEVDSTFYRIPYQSTVNKWRTQTQPQFTFSAKFPKVITHTKLLSDTNEEVRRFLESISLLREKMGPLLLQLPPNFKKENIAALRDFLDSMPDGYRVTVEVRNREVLSTELFSLLRERSIPLALVDHPYLPTVEEVTGDFVYIRCEGDRRKIKGTSGIVEVDRSADTKKWAERIRKYVASSLEVFVYFSKFYSGYPPQDAEQLKEYIQR